MIHDDDYDDHDDDHDPDENLVIDDVESEDADCIDILLVPTGTKSPVVTKS